jgi:hypothetical protein
MDHLASLKPRWLSVVIILQVRLMTFDKETRESSSGADGIVLVLACSATPIVETSSKSS